MSVPVSYAELISIVYVISSHNLPYNITTEVQLATLPQMCHLGHKHKAALPL